MPNDSSAQPTPPDQAGRWSWHQFGRNALIVSGLVALLVWFVVDGVVPNFVPKNFGVVEEGRVYRSGELTVEALRSVIKDHGIKTIIDFGAHDHDPPGERREQAVADILGVTRHVLYMSGDATGDPNNYVKALRIMTDESAQPVLVHCAAGAQRTGCAIALYRGIVSGWDDERALREAEDYRHDPEDNPLVHEMYHTWRDKIEQALRHGGTVNTADEPARGG